MLRNSSLHKSWQSFDDPTYAILLGHKRVMGQKLYSNSNGTIDYSTGSIMLEVQNLVATLCHLHFATLILVQYTATARNRNVNRIFTQSTALMHVMNGGSITYYYDKSSAKSSNRILPESYYQRPWESPAVVVQMLEGTKEVGITPLLYDHM